MLDQIVGVSQKKLRFTQFTLTNPPLGHIEVSWLMCSTSEPQWHVWYVRAAAWAAGEKKQCHCRLLRFVPIHHQQCFQEERGWVGGGVFLAGHTDVLSWCHILLPRWVTAQELIAAPNHRPWEATLELWEDSYNLRLVSRTEVWTFVNLCRFVSFFMNTLIHFFIIRQHFYRLQCSMSFMKTYLFEVVIKAARTECLVSVLSPPVISTQHGDLMLLKFTKYLYSSIVIHCYYNYEPQAGLQSLIFQVLIFKVSINTNIQCMFTISMHKKYFYISVIS